MSLEAGGKNFLRRGRRRWETCPGRTGTSSGEEEMSKSIWGRRGRSKNEQERTRLKFQPTFPPLPSVLSRARRDFCMTVTAHQVNLSISTSNLSGEASKKVEDPWGEEIQRRRGKRRLEARPILNPFPLLSLAAATLFATRGSSTTRRNYPEGVQRSTQRFVSLFEPGPKQKKIRRVSK